MSWTAVGAAAVTVIGGATDKGSATETVQKGTTTSESTSDKTSKLTAMDEQSKAQLDSLTSALLKKQSKGFDTEAAKAEYAGMIQNIFDSMNKQYMPKIYSGMNQAGAYDSTSSQLMANDAFASAVSKASEAVMTNVTQREQFDTKTTLDSVFNALGLQAQVTQSGTSTEKSKGTSTTTGNASSTGSAGGPFSGLFG